MQVALHERTTQAILTLRQREIEAYPLPWRVGPSAGILTTFYAESLAAMTCKFLEPRMPASPVAPFVIARDFRAPRALLWQVQTQAEHLQLWLSPEGFHTIHASMDFRVGGSYHYGIEGPNGLQMWGLQQFLEIAPERKIVHLQSFSDKDRGLARHPMAPTCPAHMHVTATYEDGARGATTYTISWQPHQSDEAGIAAFDGARGGMQAGFAGTFAKLDAYLAKIQA